MAFRIFPFLSFCCKDSHAVPRRSKRRARTSFLWRMGGMDGKEEEEEEGVRSVKGEKGILSES